jgi:predicted nucleic acid-binding protein
VNSSFVCDSSAVAALLIDSGPDGQWVTHTVDSGTITAPTLVTYETANVIRRHELSGQISPDQAVQAHADLLDLTIELWPYEILAARAWELRHNLSIYDATYVALAETTDLILITLDKRLAKAPGAKCLIAAP